jgi:NitT/TauT family transport system ATP-binding protein
VALGSSWKIAVMGEVFTTSDGIGGMIKLARLNVEPENIIAWSIVVVMLFYVSRLFNWKDINKGGMIVLVVKEVTKSFDDLPVLNNIGFQIADNEIVALIGPSGCGKSTLLNIISGLEPLDIGKIEYSGDAISYVFQDDRLLQWRSVWDNIRIVNNTINENEISELICDVGLKGFEKYKPNQLSGGMKKRCGIARAFYYKSKLLIMDEPFQGLDYCLRQEMLKMLLRVWNRRKQSVLFITHEIDEALTVAGRIVVMSKRPGTIVQEFNLKGIEDRSLSSLEINNIRQQIVSSLT